VTRSVLDLPKTDVGRYLGGGSTTAG